jgi:hypothetical protein
MGAAEHPAFPALLCGAKIHANPHRHALRERAIVLSAEIRDL